MMIYQINYDLNKSYNSFFKLLESIGDFAFFNKTVYINSTQHKSDIIKQIKEILSEDEQFMIKNIDINNCSLPYQIQQWIDKIKFDQYLIELDTEKQKVKNNMIKFLEDFENNLKQQLKDGSGVNVEKQADGDK